MHCEESRRRSPKLAVHALAILVAVAFATACGGDDGDRLSSTPPTRSVVPSVGQTSVVPDDVDGDYFVSPAECDDGGPGTRDEPFCSIQRGVDALEPGNVLTILPGVYEERVEVHRSGSSDEPIVIQGTSAGDVIVDGGCRRFPCPEDAFPEDGVFDGLRVADQQHVVIRDITVENAPQYGIAVERATGVTIQGTLTRATGMSGISVYDSTELRVRDNEVTRVNLGVQYSDGSVEYPEEAISIVNSSEFEVSQNHVHDSWKEGIDAKVGSRDGSIHHNRVERQCAVGIYINEAHRLDVHHNVVLDSGWIESDGQVVPCGQLLGEEYDGGNALLMAVGDLGGIGDGTLSEIHVYQNVLAGSWLSCLVFWDELRERGGGRGRMSDVRVVNNVLYECGRSGWGPGIVLDDVESSLIENNIIAVTEQGSIVGNAVGVAGNLVSHSLFYRAGEPAGTDAVVGDPLFVDPAGRDFRVRPESPTIDAGTDVGLPVAGAAPDIGAHEQGIE